MQYKISASILSVNFANLGKEIDALIDGGTDSIHLDVMDNHYVPNLTFGSDFCKAIHQHSPKINLDVHIMAYNIDPLIASFAANGAHSITIHPDQTVHLHRNITEIKQHNIVAGVALNPATPINSIEYILDEIDQVLIMSVNPGFGGQKFITSSLKKIEKLKNLITQKNHDISIAVDGGINLDTICSIKDAGADIFVIGNAITNTDNYLETIQEFRTLLSR